MSRITIKMLIAMICICVFDVAPAAAQQSNRKLSGVVLDKENKEPIIGANVWIKNTTVGTSTNLDGQFSLNVPEGKTQTIVVKCIGYKELEKEISPSSNSVVFELSTDAQLMDEVVVVGFGSQKRESVIGSISTISTDKLKIPNASISSNLAGQLGGIVSVQRSGAPGSQAEFWIRGVSTFGGNKYPLILVDGVERSLDLLDPEEIERFSLLKDAAATALYGVRGANGVILVTTKRGSEGKPKISIKVEGGFLQPTKVPELADAVDFATVYNDMKGYDHYSQADIQKYRDGSDPDLFPNVNWIKAVFKDYTTNQRITANVNGGGSVARYFISAAYYREDGIFKSDGSSRNANPKFERYNFRSNLDVNLHETTVLGLTVGGYLTQKRDSENQENIWNTAFVLEPNAFPIKYSNGYWAQGPEASNPYYMVTNAGYRQDWQSTINAMLALDQDFKFITKGLKGNIKFAFDTQAWHRNQYTQQDEMWLAQGRDAQGELLFTAPVKKKGGPWFKNESSGNNATYLEGSLNYNRDFGKHSVGALLLYNHRIFSKTAGSAIESLNFKNQGLAGRATYNYDSRYFIEGNFGYNGSENFAPGHRVGFFPSVAVGWYMSNEPFFEPLTGVISKLKFKTSYGQVGNDQIDGVRFIYLGTVANAGGYQYGNYQWTEGERPDVIPNPNVSWEVSTKQNYGVEIGLFNKLDIQADWYDDVRDKIFVQNNNIPSYAGIGTKPMVNIGKMHSWGFDSSLEYNDKFGDLYVSGRATFTYASNKILNNGDELTRYEYMSKIGQKNWQRKGFQALGLFESQDEIDRSPVQFSEGMHSTLRPGDIKYKDINGDGKINDEDIIPIGLSDIPEITYGFGGSVGWKGFDFALFFQGIGRVSAQLTGSSIIPFSAGYAYQKGFYKDIVGNYWTEENPDPKARYPRLNEVKSADNNNAKSSTFWLRDASYLRLKNVELGYSLPKSWLSKANVQGLRIYVSGVNLFTYAPDMTLYDPEINDGQGRKYPTNRIYNIGINLNF